MRKLSFERDPTVTPYEAGAQERRGRKRSLSTAYRVPPLPNLPLYPNDYFRALSHQFLACYCIAFPTAKTCIICGQRAGSREHIFPAALGCRRTNKGIDCGPHNRGFSHLAKIITQQLKSINALLAVRPDHEDSAEPLDYTSPEGERLVIFDGIVKRATSGKTDSERGPHVQLTLGGPDGLRSIAYIALTFFAHHFQDYALVAALMPSRRLSLEMETIPLSGGRAHTRRPRCPQIPFLSVTLLY